MHTRRTPISIEVMVLAIVVLALSSGVRAEETDVGRFLNRYCADCHASDADDEASLNGFDIAHFETNSAIGERVIPQTQCETNAAG